jgi:hypothetical protein
MSRPRTTPLSGWLVGPATKPDTTPVSEPSGPTLMPSGAPRAKCYGAAQKNGLCSLSVMP